MIGHRSITAGNRRRAFTLVEVMLTLSLLVIITSLAWPVLQGPFANQRLRKAADKIRVEWCSARVEAMDSGHTYIFRYSAEENRYRIVRYTAGETTDGSILDDTAEAPTEDTLPQGVTFVTGETESDTRAAMINSDDDSQYASEDEWAEPIFFYPDGTTSTARLVLKNEHERYIELKLRGLTGVVNISDLYADEGGLP